MIIKHVAGRKRLIASLMLVVLYIETIIPSYALGAPVVVRGMAKPAAVMPLPFSKNEVKKLPDPASKNVKAFIGGPTQPETQGFHSVGSEDMVNLFTGDFHYTIPLLDVGGYPLALGYNSGIGMDQEASWVGLGWDLNPGAITRNLRGLPDDFNGTDTIQKRSSIKPNKTFGAMVELSDELIGYNRTKAASDSASKNGSVSISFSAGVVHDNYKGWGIQSGVDVGLSSGAKAMGSFSGKLSVSNSSMDGLTLGVGLSDKIKLTEDAFNGPLSGTVGVGTGYNSRAGMKNLQLNMGYSQYIRVDKDNENRKFTILPGISGSVMSFAYPSYLPKVSLPFTNSNYTYSFKLGGEIMGLDYSVALMAFGSNQEIAKQDQRLSLPAYGYLNSQNAGNREAVLLDFNREKDIPYREKPATPNIGIPSYTYDVFSISGEGIGGSFRAYRSDIGHVFDPYTRTKSKSTNISGDFGAGGLFHVGADIALTYAYTETGLWKNNNYMTDNTGYTSSYGQYEAAFFRNPGEMTINNKDFYKHHGGDDVVAVKVHQSGPTGATIIGTTRLNRYRNSKLIGEDTINAANVNRNVRDKRTQVISYLTAEEAKIAGFPKFIENYGENIVRADACPDTIANGAGSIGDGLLGEYFEHMNFERKLFERIDTALNFVNLNRFNQPPGSTTLNTRFSVRWTGRIKAPVTGLYRFYTRSDDGVSIELNGKNITNNWKPHNVSRTDTAFLALVGGEFYDLKVLYYNINVAANFIMEWDYPGQERVVIPKKALYLRDTVYQDVNDGVIREARVNTFRNNNHISEIDVLNTDGKKYVYGIPVYNLVQKDVTFSVNKSDGDADKGLVGYTPGVDDDTTNRKGNDQYFSSEQTPAYAHTFLLSAILSPDYKDLTGDGITSDDPGDAIKFNYTKTANVTNPFSWRAPLGESKANYNEGLRTDDRDDKGSYAYGEKELWYLNSIESKNMIAVFIVSQREDMWSIGEDGKVLVRKPTRKLDQIDLYTKAEVKKPNRKPLKTVHFEYGYDLCNGVNGKANTQGKLTLKRIWFTYNGNKKGERHPYVFNYNNTNPGYSPKDVDRWGTYKPMSDNPDNQNNNDFPFAVQDSTVAARNAAAWTMSSINLPSGGRIGIDYEADDYAFVQNKRAGQLFNIAGFSAIPAGPYINSLYQSDLQDFMYVAVKVPVEVNTQREIYTRYLEGLDKIYFRLYVNMPSDKYGSGSEYVNCYAKVDPGNYGKIDSRTIWFKVNPINKNGEIDNGSKTSPMAKAAVSFLRMNLGSKAYPGSEVGDDVNFVDVVKMIASQAGNIVSALESFDKAARRKGWAEKVNLARSYVRLNDPDFRKYGGGVRVKRVVTYDNWDKMTNQTPSQYGQEYDYTTVRRINGVDHTISSGVAAYEPIIGGEDNPWRQPLEYTQQVSALAPTAIGYTETPLGEGFFPSPSVGYSKVRVRSINTKNTRSANGFTETCFYTTYDFPTMVEYTTVEKARYNPKLFNLFKINVRHYLTTTQGFKVELNDMNGKLKSQAMYGEANAKSPITSSINYYRVDDQQAEFKHLNNTVMAMDASGYIDTAAIIGKDIELMTDMREQRSVTIATNLQINVDGITFGLPPVLPVPGFYAMYNNEETIYRSAAVSKIIYRHGVLDSIIAEDKGSKVITRNLLYDSETGNPILNSTQNEWGDPIYTFSLPGGWAYDGLSGAYRNINVLFDSLTILKGKIVEGLPAGKKATDYFAGGDRLLAYFKPNVTDLPCTVIKATFPAPGVLYAVDANVQQGGEPDIYFVDKQGQPFTGYGVTMKVVQSGRKNIQTNVNTITLLNDPRVIQDNKYKLVINENSRVVNAAAVEFKELWKVADSRAPGSVITCIPEGKPADNSATCDVQNTYSNSRIVKSFYPSCANGTTPNNPVVYVVEEGKYVSGISQFYVDSVALAELNTKGQANADTVGGCFTLFPQCATCTQVDTAYKKYLATYPGIVPNVDNSTPVQQTKNRFFAAYMNNATGYNKLAAEYLAFINSCSAFVPVGNGYCKQNPSTGNILTYTVANSTTEFQNIVNLNTGFLLIGSVTTSNIRYGYLVKTDANGKVEWSRRYRYTSSTSNNFLNAQPTQDGGYIAIGTSRISNDDNAFIVKVAANGEKQWAQTLTVPSGATGYDIVQASNGRYVFSLRGASSSHLVYGVVVALDVSGTKLWAKSLNWTGNGNEGYPLVVHNDTVVVAGCGVPASNQPFGFFIASLRLGDGNSISTFTYETPDNSAYGLYSKHLFKTPQGYLVNFTRSIFNGSGVPIDNHNIVMSVDYNGGVLYAKELTNPYTNPTNVNLLVIPIQLNPVTQTLDGGIMTIQNFGLWPQQPTWRKLNNNRNLSWSNAVKTSRPTEIRALVQHESGVYAATGRYGDSAILMLTNPSGELNCNDSLFVNDTVVNFAYKYSSNRFRTIADVSDPLTVRTTSVTADSITTKVNNVDCEKCATEPILCDSTTFTSAVFPSYKITNEEKYHVTPEIFNHELSVPTATGVFSFLYDHSNTGQPAFARRKTGMNK